MQSSKFAPKKICKKKYLSVWRGASVANLDGVRAFGCVCVRDETDGRVHTHLVGRIGVIPDTTAARARCPAGEAMATPSLLDASTPFFLLFFFCQTNGARGGPAGERPKKKKKCRRGAPTTLPPSPTSSSVSRATIGACACVFSSRALLRCRRLPRALAWTTVCCRARAVYGNVNVRGYFFALLLLDTKPTATRARPFPAAHQVFKSPSSSFLLRHRERDRRPKKQKIQKKAPSSFLIFAKKKKGEESASS